MDHNLHVTSLFLSYELNDDSLKNRKCGEDGWETAAPTCQSEQQAVFFFNHNDMWLLKDHGSGNCHLPFYYQHIISQNGPLFGLSCTKIYGEHMSYTDSAEYIVSSIDFCPHDCSRHRKSMEDTCPPQMCPQKSIQDTCPPQKSVEAIIIMSSIDFS